MLALVIAASVSGCVILDDKSHSYRDGWSVGWVSRIVTAAEITPDQRFQSPCLAALGNDLDLTQRFTVVGYSHLRSMRYALFPIPETLALHVGDRVRINLADCTQTIAHL